MVVRAVVFDVGGVLELESDPHSWLEKWRLRVGLNEDEMRSAAQSIDPDGLMQTGGMGEDEFRGRWARALALSEPQADEFMRDVWDWYCGELDELLFSYAASLRGQYAVAVLSNSGSGAREQEEARYGFSAVFDPIIYSHEVGLVKPDPRIYDLTCNTLGVEPHEAVFLDDSQLSVDGANDFGMTGVLHRGDAADSIRAINDLIA